MFYIYVYKSFSTVLDKSLRKNILKKEMEKLENKLNELGALKNRKSETNEIKVQDPHIVLLFLNMAAH